MEFIRMLRIFTAIIITFITLITSVFGIGKTGAALLKQFAGSRAAAMGEAFVAVADDIYALHYNPAGLVGIRREFGAMHYIDPTVGFNFGYLGYGQTIKGIGVLAGSIFMFDGGKFEHQENDTAPVRTLSVQQDFIYAIGFSREIINNFSTGINAKIYTSMLSEKSFAKSYCFDFGTLYATPIKGLKIGAVIQNIGTPVKYLEEKDPLPQTIRVGASYSLKLLNDYLFLFSADALKYKDDEIKENFGLECVYKDLAVMRAGYKIGNDNGNYSLGIGLRWYGLQVDYGAIFQKFTMLNPISITWKKTRKKIKPIQVEEKIDLPETIIEQPIVKAEQVHVTADGGLSIEQLTKQFNILCKRGEYIDAFDIVLELNEIDTDNIEYWDMIEKKLSKIVEIIPSEKRNDKIYGLIRKAINSYLTIDGNERIAVIASKYILQLEPENQEAINLNKIITQEYPGTAIAETTVTGKTIIEQKLSAALDYIYESKFDKAIMECDDVLALEPNNVMALKRKGSANYALGKKAIAKELWEKASRLLPDDPETKEFFLKLERNGNGK